MSSAIVADSTCLIGLERVGRLEILHSLFSPLLIPPEVCDEFGSDLSWLEIVEYSNKALFQMLRLRLDKGEAAALTLAQEKGVPAILDDRQARKVARQIGVSVTGTLGVLIRAKRAGIISQIRPVLDDLDEAEFYVDIHLRTETLRLANES